MKEVHCIEIISKLRTLVEMYFSFILLLALSPIEDLHVKLRSATVIVEQQEPLIVRVRQVGNPKRKV
jgi:hypothetical protein